VHQRLDDASIVALLDAATREDAPESALYAFSRLSPRNPTVQRRLLDAATKSLEAEGLRRTFAVRALAGAGDEAAEPLGRVLGSAAFSASERAGAVRALEKLGVPGQEVLKTALAELIPDKPDAPELGGETFTPLMATLDALKPPLSDAAAALAKLAELPLPPESEAVFRRRAIRVRCRAAALLAGHASLAARLVACDPREHGRVGELAVVQVLDAGPLVGGRLRRWVSLTKASDPVVQQAALRLLAGHPEVGDAHVYLAHALASKEPGIVATAAQILAAYPARATPGGDDDERAARPHADVITAFKEIFERKELLASVEVTAALIDAAAALQLLGQKSKLEQFCRADNATLREHAERALGMLGDQARSCDSFTPATEVPKGLEKALSAREPRRLRFATVPLRYAAGAR
jgi:hypothetical protein